MPLRRRSVKTKTKLSRAVATCETLESRKLLTSVINGVFSGTNTAFDGLSYFEYKQANGNATIRISVFGSISAEFVGAAYDTSSGTFTESNLIASTPTNTSNIF